MNFKALIISGLTAAALYYGSYKGDAWINKTDAGYNGVEKGVRYADRTMAHALSSDSSADPILDLIQEKTGVRLRWREPYFTQNDYRAFSGAHKLAGYGQGLGIGIAGLAGLVGLFGRRR